MTATATHPVEPNSVSFLRDMSGPYSATNNGTCAEGHPVNGSGRCDVLNKVQADAAGISIAPATATAPPAA